MRKEQKLGGLLGKVSGTWCRIGGQPKNPEPPLQAEIGQDIPVKAEKPAYLKDLQTALNTEEISSAIAVQYNPWMKRDELKTFIIEGVGGFYSSLKGSDQVDTVVATDSNNSPRIVLSGEKIVP